MADDMFLKSETWFNKLDPLLVSNGTQHLTQAYPEILSYYIETFEDGLIFRVKLFVKTKRGTGVGSASIPMSTRDNPAALNRLGQRLVMALENSRRKR